MIVGNTKRSPVIVKESITSIHRNCNLILKMSVVKGKEGERIVITSIHLSNDNLIQKMSELKGKRGEKIVIEGVQSMMSIIIKHKLIQMVNQVKERTRKEGIAIGVQNTESDLLMGTQAQNLQKLIFKMLTGRIMAS